MGLDAALRKAQQQNQRLFHLCLPPGGTAVGSGESGNLPGSPPWELPYTALRRLGPDDVAWASLLRGDVAARSSQLAACSLVAYLVASRRSDMATWSLYGT